VSYGTDDRDRVRPVAEKADLQQPTKPCPSTCQNLSFPAHYWLSRRLQVQVTGDQTLKCRDVIVKAFRHLYVISSFLVSFDIIGLVSRPTKQAGG